MDPIDIANAHSYLQDTASNLEDLQATDFWHQLDADIRITFCKAHAMSRGLTNAMELYAPKEASDGDD